MAAAGRGSGGNEGGRGEGGAPRGRRGLRRPLAALLVLLTALGGFASVFLIDSGYMPFFSMTTAWQLPYDSEPSGDGDGVWLVDDTVVRSRFDGVTGYDVRSGKKRWEHVIPGRTEVCAADTDPAAGVALIAYRAAGPAKKKAGGCATVVAIGLADGRELWRTADAGPAGGGTVVGVGHGLGVFLDGGRLRAVDLRTGTARWTTALPKGCGLGDLGLAPKRLVAALGCEDEAMLAAFGPDDGTVRWTVPLDARRGVAADAGLSVVSADPPTVRVDEQGGRKGFFAFGPDGRSRSRIGAVGDYGSIGRTAVADGRLITIASYEGGQGGAWERLVAFDLATGGELWRERVGNGSSNVEALDVTDGRVTTVRTDWKYGDTLYVHDAATGDEEDDRAFRDQVVDYGNPVRDLLTHGDLLIVVRGYDGARPFSVYDRW
ncbi:PQQ-binding-like beta-propeller repeat protein [Streptomyces sp. NPDC058195]|uniref:outer membrane protein assembly factor BamB family protein n=1 Tax=Streptomyces sp. NPDC058195 TaxID=3346375 RepID=UPI0036E3157F